MSFRTEGEVRRSQLLFRAGPGALVDLLDHAVIIKGLDDWGYPKGGPDGFELQEPRLAAKALKILQSAGHWKHERVLLRLPPQCDGENPYPTVGVPAGEFPQWFMCQHGKCNSLVKRRALDSRHRHVCSANSKGFPAVPIRFVLACPKGHVADVNWMNFVHRGEREEETEGTGYYCNLTPGEHLDKDPLGGDANADLYLRSLGTTGDLTDTIIGCRRCGKTRGLQDLTQQHNHGRCSGWRPWLPPGSNEVCEEKSHLLTRTGSNAYFPQSISALSIPSGDAELVELVKKFWTNLSGLASVTHLAVLRTALPGFAAAFENCEDSEVWSAIQRVRTGSSSDLPLREVEWRAMRDAPWASLGDMPSRDDVYFARAEDQPLPEFLDRIVLVHKLREVRAQVGFSRLESVDLDPEGEFNLSGHQSAPLSLNQNWIPAIEARGEGIFLAFNETWLGKWETQPQVLSRMGGFESASVTDKGQLADRLALQARLLFLHTLSHMLITQISLEAGYPAASIQERLYCYRDPKDPKRSRGGILLSTGTTGSSGTLGGLVQVGKEITRHLQEACERALLCSNDPVCSQHDPSVKEEGRERHGAACHACVLIAESSCERMNQDLDRSLVVPTVHDSDLAALGPWLNEGSGL